MAKNWKPYEAAVAVKAGDKEAIVDLGRRFPQFMLLANNVNEAGMALLAALPKYVTARQIESILRNGQADDEAEATETEEAEVEEVEEEKPAKKAKATKKEEAKPAKKAPAKKVEEDEDDWGEDEEEEAKPAKKSKAPKKDEKPAKKSKPAKDEDDDDDWDL